MSPLFTTVLSTRTLYNNPRLNDGPTGESLTLRLADEAVKFNSTPEPESDTQPYFAMLAFYTVHGPVQTSQPLWKKYRDAAPPAPADSQSLRNLLAGQSDELIRDRPLIWHYPHYDNDLKDDPAEQHDVAAEDPQRVRHLRGLLLSYLRTVEAKFPTPDPRYDAVQAKTHQAQVTGPGKRKLERAHAQMLEPDYQPDPTWWGSSAD